MNSDKLNNCLESKHIKPDTISKISELLNQSVPVLMGMFVFFNPFPHTTAIKEISFYLSVLIIFVLIGFKKIKLSFKSPFAVPGGLFVIWAFLSIFFAIDKENSLHDFYSHLLRYIIIYFILINFFSSKRLLVRLSWIIIVSAALFCLGSIYFEYFIIGNSLSTRLGLSFTEIPTNRIGIITTFSAILCMHNLLAEKQLYRKILLISFLLPIFTASILTQSRLTVIAIFLACILLFLNNKKALITVVGGVLLITICTPVGSRFNSDGAGSILNNSRIDIAIVTLEIIKDNPIIGIGFGMQSFEKIDSDYYYKKIADKYKPLSLKKPIVRDPHGIFLDIAMRIGLIGLLLFLHTIYLFLKICRDYIKHGNDDFIKNWGRCIASCFVAFLVIGIGEPILNHIPEVVLCTLFSMVTILWRLNEGMATSN